MLFGISADSVHSHQEFRDKYGLTTPLLADPEGKVCQLYGVWKNPGVQRQTFAIDEKGNLLHHWPKVDPGTHAADVLAAIGK